MWRSTANDVKVVEWELDAEFALVSRTDLVSIEWGGVWSVKEGCRIRFRPGTDELFVTTGDAHLGTNPQNLAVKAGKVLRVTRDGEPYPGQSVRHHDLHVRASQPTRACLPSDHE